MARARSLPVTMNGDVYSITRPMYRTAAKLKPGDRYFLLVWPEGLEQSISLSAAEHGMGRVRGALDVEVIDVRGDVVIERTWTWNFPSLKREGYTNSIPPRGRGWVMADDSHDKFTVYQRERDWKVV